MFSFLRSCSGSAFRCDIKPANIFLTARGPKILDFGLAKTVATDSVVVADANGANERVLATRNRPSWFTAGYRTGAPAPRTRPQWSPDGRYLAVLGADRVDDTTLVRRQVTVIDVTGGESRALLLPVDASNEHGVGWLDSQSLVVNFAETPASPVQLWRLSYADGVFSRLTNDLNDYIGIDVSADRTEIATARYERRGTLWVWDASTASGADIIPPSTSVLQGVGWVGERVLYARGASSRRTIVAVEPGRQAEEEIAENTVSATGSADGQTIVFRSIDLNGGLWRTGLTGGQPVQLVTGYAEAPAITSDGQVIFISNRGGVQSVWRVNLHGGPPSQVTNLFAATGSLDLAPGGKMIVFQSRNDQGRAAPVVCELPGCTSRRILPNLGGSSLRWTPDGRNLAVAIGANIWVQPLDGSPRHQLSRFADPLLVADFRWSPDGRRLAISRFSASNDIVLFRGLK